MGNIIWGKKNLGDYIYYLYLTDDGNAKQKGNYFNFFFALNSSLGWSFLKRV